MTRVVDQHGGVNLAQGMPNSRRRPSWSRRPTARIDGDFHQYAITWGAPRLRRAIAEKYRQVLRDGRRSRPPRHGVLRLDRDHAGDPARRAEPGRRGHHLRAVLRELRAGLHHRGRRAGLGPARAARLHVRSRPAAPGGHAAHPRHRLQQPEQSRRQGLLAAELQIIADLCLEHDLLAITDEIYEHIVYDGLGHTPIATLPGMAERTITISGISKSYSVTGWRVGYAIAPPELSRRHPARPRLRHGGRAAPACRRPR